MIPKVKTILYATGLGSGAPFVFRHALNEAKKHQAGMVVLHVMEPLNPFGRHLVELHISPEQSEDIQKRAREYALEKIRERVQILCDRESCTAVGGENIVSEIRVIEGQPHLEIINQGREMGADMIVIGSHRHSAIGETMLGHTANKVVHRSEIPVLLVRIPKGYREEGF